MIRRSSKRMERYAELRSAAPMKKVNRKRSKAAFERCYHSKGRVAFVQALHCVVDGCESTRSDNAHVVRDDQKGGSRKAGFLCIAPLCREHHAELDDVLGREKFQEKHGCDLQHEADQCERKFQTFLAHGGEPFEETLSFALDPENPLEPDDPQDNPFTEDDA